MVCSLVASCRLAFPYLIKVASNLERDIARQIDMTRSYEDPHESLLSGKQPYFSNMALNAEPVSPRQVPIDERRPSLHAFLPRPNAFRPQAPAAQNNMPMPQRRYGSIGTANPLPNYVRPMHTQTQMHQPPAQHPLSIISEPPGPNMGRRHTSADIRVPGWPGHGTGTATGSPLTSGQSSGHWPSSPTQGTVPADQNIRDQLASYELGAPRKSFSVHQTTPPLTSNDPTPPAVNFDNQSHWSNPNPFGGSKPQFQSRLLDSAPPTRRSSMQSNVHTLLNHPSETVEREEDDFGDDRKRKRMQ